MADYSTKQIIDYAYDDEGVEFRKALYASIHDKVAAAIEAKKQEVAENLLGLNDNEEEEFDGEEEQEEVTMEEEVEELDEMDSYPHPDSKEGKELLKMKMKKKSEKHSKDLKMPSAKETLGNLSKSFSKMK